MALRSFSLALIGGADDRRLRHRIEHGRQPRDEMVFEAARLRTEHQPAARRRGDFSRQVFFRQPAGEIERLCYAVLAVRRQHEDRRLRGHVFDDLADQVVRAAKFGDAVEHLYRRADDLVGDIVKHVDPETTVLVLSAYGEHGVTQTFDLTRWLSEEHLPGTITATTSGGLVLSGEAHGVEDHLIARLTAVLDPATKTPVVSAAYKRETVYTGPYLPNAPDVQLGLAPGYGIATAPAVFAPNKRR